MFSSIADASTLFLQKKIHFRSVLLLLRILSNLERRTPIFIIRFSLRFNPLKAALATSFDKTFKPIVTHEIHELGTKIFYDFLQFEFFNFSCPCHLKTSLLKITYPSFLGWQDILALVKSWVLLEEKNFKIHTFLLGHLTYKNLIHPQGKSASASFFFFLRRPIRFHCIIIKTRSSKAVK